VIRHARTLMVDSASRIHPTFSPYASTQIQRFVAVPARPLIALLIRAKWSISLFIEINNKFKNRPIESGDASQCWK
jgi:hypothetical protein